MDSDLTTDKSMDASRVGSERIQLPDSFVTFALQRGAAGCWAGDAGGDAVEAGGACEFDADDEFIAVAGAGADVAGAGEAEIVGAHLDGDGVSGGFGEGEADTGIGDIDGGGLETVGVAAGIEPGDLDGGREGNAIVAATPESRHTFVSARDDFFPDNL